MPQSEWDYLKAAVVDELEWGDDIDAKAVIKALRDECESLREFAKNAIDTAAHTAIAHQRDIAELEATLAKLPRTSDGVPIVPGMDLYEVKGGKVLPMNDMPLCGFDITCNGRVNLFFHDRDMERDLVNVYSTRSAAEAKESK